MTRIKLPLFVASTLLLSLAIVASRPSASRGDTTSAAPSTQPAGSLAWHDVSVEMGEQKFQSGDNVQITSVRCTADQLAMGELLEVRGTYDLHSADEASLCLFMTATDGNGTGPIYPQQTMTAKKGHGEFVLREPITCHGWPHVSFYDKNSGQNTGGVYFGYGPWLNKGHGVGTDVINKK